MNIYANQLMAAPSPPRPHCPIGCGMVRGTCHCGPPQLRGLGAAGDGAGPAIYGLLGAVSVGVSAYYGYKCNGSIWRSVVWGIVGGLFPVITPTIAVARSMKNKC